MKLHTRRSAWLHRGESLWGMRPCMLQVESLCVANLSRPSDSTSSSSLSAADAAALAAALSGRKLLSQIAVQVRKGPVLSSGRKLMQSAIIACGTQASLWW